MLIWYHGLAMDLFFFMHTKKYKHPMHLICDVTMTFLPILPNLPIYNEISAKVEVFAKKF